MGELIKYPVGIQSFSEIRGDGYIYADKTAHVHRLVSTGKYYFLSRPRRFGKSLLLSTLEALFRGRRELFRGLAIDSLPWDWERHEVLHLDLNVRYYKDETSLLSILDRHLAEWEEKYGIQPKTDIPEDRFIAVIKRAFEQSGRGVAILIDEYDKPILSVLNNPELQTTYRHQLQAFYGVIKSLDSFIRFAILTGVTRFSKVSVFSGLNNLKDISLSDNYDAICGITEEELMQYFTPGIEEMARKGNSTADEVRATLKQSFDGYHFSAHGRDIYNPFSLLNTFSEARIGSYWFATGTPTFLVHLLETSQFPIPEMEGYRCTEEMLTGSDVYMRDPVPIFFQSGYLTIKGYDAEFGEYILGFPNKEVSEGFAKFLMKIYMHSSEDFGFISDFVRSVRAGRAMDFMEMLQSFIAGIPYDHEGPRGEREVHYQNVIYVLFKLMGFYTHTEFRTSNGRIDLLVETADYVYILEFKLNSTAEAAMRQINEKNYALPFRSSAKRIFKIGASFSGETRRLDSFIIEEE